MRAESDGALQPGSDGSTTGNDGPVTTGVTGISSGADDSSANDDTTTSQPGPSTAGDSSYSGNDTTGADESGDDTTGGDESGDDEGSSSTGGLPEDEVDLSGWTLAQTSSAREFTFPAGTVVPAGTVIVIGRDAERAAFEQYWGRLGDDAVYFNGSDVFPAINGDETFSVRDDADAVIDGPTPALEMGTSLHRDDGSAAGSWTPATESEADPGVGVAEPDSPGVFVTEASDASGAGNYVFEYVELQVW